MDYRQVRIHPEAVVVPNATIIGDVEICRGAVVLFNAVLRGDYGSRIVIGEGSNVQEGCCFHLGASSDCIIGAGVTVGHGATLHGCTIEDNVLIGMEAVVMDGAVVGRDSIVAAGAVVTGGTVVPPGSLVMGAPAKVRRELTTEEIESNRYAAEDYVEVGRDLVEQGIAYRGADVPDNLPLITLAPKA